MPPPRRLNAVPSQPGRAVLYIRVSATMGRSGEDFHSPDLQLEALRRHVTPVGLREVAVVQDIDASGRSFSREGLDQIRRMVEAKKLDVIAVYDISRLGRNVAEALTFIRWLRERGVGIISTVEQITDSPEGQFMLTQFLAMAQLYSDQMGRRWSDVLARRAREQGLGHGKVPIGYVKEGRELSIDPTAGSAIGDVIRAYADGESTVSLAKKIGALRGYPIAPTTVRKLATSRFYLGEVPNRGVWYPGEHDPLVTPEVHAAAVARAARDADMPARSRVPAYSLSGLLWCGECEGRARTHVATSTKGRARRVTVMCAAQIARFPKGCDGFGTPPLATIEAEVLAQLRRKVSQLRDDPEARSARHAEQERLRQRRGRIKQELDTETAALGRLTGQWARRKVPAAVYDAAIAEFEAKESALRAALAEMDIPAATVDAATFAALADRLLGMWDEMDGPLRGRALRTVVRRIAVYRGDKPGQQRVDVKFV